MMPGLWPWLSPFMFREEAIRILQLVVVVGFVSFPDDEILAMPRSLSKETLQVTAYIYINQSLAVVGL